jgi:hypothetical protein
LTPTITPSPTQQPTSTPAPTSTPEPTATPQPTATNTPTPSPTNAPPVVNAGADTTITLPETYQLLGVATDDGLPNPPSTLNTSWTLQSVFPAGGTITFVDSDPVQPIVSFSAPGIYTLKFTVTDSSIETTDTVNIVVLPAPTNTPTPSNTPSPTLSPTPGPSNTPTLTPTPLPPVIISVSKVANFFCFASCSGAVNILGSNIDRTQVSRVSLKRTGFTRNTTSLTGNPTNTNLIASFTGVTTGFDYSVVITFLDGSTMTAPDTVSIP